MNVWLLLTLIIIFAYWVLAYTAYRTGWLERHNMSLALYFIIMWRTQRGKRLIERISGRATRRDAIEGQLAELAEEREEARQRLGSLERELVLAHRTERYLTLAGDGAEGDDGIATDDGEDLEELAFELSTEDRFKHFVEAPPAPETRERLEELVSETTSSVEGVRETLASLDAREAELGEELARLGDDGEGQREMRSSRRRVRFWRAYGNVSIAIVLTFMFIMLALLVWQAFLVVKIPPGIIKAQHMVGIPGINPIIPLWYGIFGLAVAMIVHEFAHGILARAGKIVVKSLGLLYAVVPIGAFVEPDEDELAKVDRGRRSRVFAVGPATNIIVGLLVAMVFAWGFMASVEPAEDGVMLNRVVDEQTIEVNGTDTLRKTPASIAGLEPWSIITRMESLEDPPIGADGGNVSVIRDTEDFLDTMDRTQGGQQVRITWWSRGNFHNATVELWDRGEVYGPEYAGQGYLGASSRLNYEVPTGEYVDALAHPLRYSNDLRSFRNVTFFYISLPFNSPTLQPAPAVVTDAFEIHGPLAALGDGGFWVVANVLYWIFWLNIMVGIFNALPAIPLDGGYIFRDGLSWLLERFVRGKDQEALDGLALKATLGLSFLILLLIIWQFVGPSFGAAVGL